MAKNPNNDTASFRCTPFLQVGCISDFWGAFLIFGVHFQLVGFILSVSDAPRGVDTAPRQSLQRILSNQGFAFAERLPDYLAQNQILIVHGVKGTHLDSEPFNQS